MKEEEIIEGNKLIAEFMGAKVMWNTNFGWYCDKQPTAVQIFTMDDLRISNMKYHSHWNWIMPVVEKIRDVSANSTIHSTLNYLHHTQGGEPFNDSHRLWEMVVQHIKWRNHNDSNTSETASA